MIGSGTLTKQIAGYLARTGYEVNGAKRKRNSQEVRDSVRFDWRVQIVSSQFNVVFCHFYKNFFSSPQHILLIPFSILTLSQISPNHPTLLHQHLFCSTYIFNASFITRMPIIGGSSESSPRSLERQNRREIARDLLNPKAPIVIGGSATARSKMCRCCGDESTGVKNPTYVTGYGGAGPIRLAYERAEVNFTQETAVGISRSVLPWVREGWTSVLYQVGFLDGKGNVAKDPAWKELGIDAPSIADAYRSIYGKDAAGAAWEAEKALIGGYSLTRMMAVAPKTRQRSSPSCAKRFRR